MYRVTFLIVTSWEIVSPLWRVIFEAGGLLHRHEGYESDNKIVKCGLKEDHAADGGRSRRFGSGERWLWTLANGKRPPTFLPSENLNRYVEDFDEPRTQPWKRRVSARRGWAGEKSDFFNSLLELVLCHAISECISSDLEETAGFGDIAACALQGFF